MLVKALEQERDALRQEGYNLGEKKGIEQGFEQGKLAAQRQTLLRLLEWRFSLSTEAQTEYAAQLERIDQLDHLLYLIDQLLAQPTLAAFAEVLQAHLPPADQSTPSPLPKT